MYILIVSRGYPTSDRKMNGIFELDQAKALVNSGHKVVLAAVDLSSIKKWRKWGFDTIIESGVHIEAINIPLGSKGGNFLLNFFRKAALKMLYKKIRRKFGEPDIIHAHFLEFGYLVAQLFYGSRIPLVLTEHLSAMNQEILTPYHKKIGNDTYRKMDAVITVSQSLANNINIKFNVNSFVVPNVIDIENFQTSNKVNMGNKFSFVSTGGLIPRKGMDLLIEAFSEAFVNNHDIELYIFGEGSERQKLENLISNYKMKNKIFLLGLVDRKEIASKMEESQCFVLATKLETFGVAYIEALAMGLPVIATICGGPEEFVTKENGILIPINDKKKLKEALILMFENSKDYNRSEISHSIKKKYGASVIAKKLTEIYSELRTKVT